MTAVYAIPRFVQLHRGEHLILPSGQMIELLALGSIGGAKWSCAYCQDGHALPPGNGERNRITLSERFLRLHARPAP